MMPNLHPVVPAGRPRTTIARPVLLMLLFAAFLLSVDAFGQGRQERSGVVLHWGLVPAAVAAERHAADELHGGMPSGGGRIHHLVVTVYDAASGHRIDNAVVRAQLHETGIVDGPLKYLTPMPVNGYMSYGQMFSVAKPGPYRFRVLVRLPDWSEEVEFAIAAGSVPDAHAARGSAGAKR